MVSRWYAVADANSSKPPFVIVLPPPNVTGALHIGHALTTAIEDTIIRWQRMSGYDTLWVPGMDHAGIRTQVVVEKKIMSERGLSRHDIGREGFVSECFTMDEKRSHAVTETEAFVRLHKSGLIYRDIRLVNWDCVLRTAISDIEVEYIDIKERTIYWMSPDMKTKVETMLGDTAIALHPKDSCYTHLHGKHAIHPFDGRRIPIICDDLSSSVPHFYITPAHDPKDFDVGKRHNLEFVNILTDDGKINSNAAPEFVGLPRFKAREAVTKALQKKIKIHHLQLTETLITNSFVHRDFTEVVKIMRCGLVSVLEAKDVVEPLIKPQWYVNCKVLAPEALNAVTDDANRKIEIIPKQYTAEWKSLTVVVMDSHSRWLENIQDWRILETIELGAYEDHWVVAKTEEDAQKEAHHRYKGKKFEMSQDPDVLDTWFSSGLFPLSVLGWPEDTADLKAFYPSSVLETGHDILFFWVARMVMLGLNLGGDVPFRKVYLHPVVRDAHGRKMSKSLGNVIDPIDIINGITLEDLQKKLDIGNLDPKERAVAKEGQKKDFPCGISECGADALRFALVSYTAQSDNINLDIQRVVGYRQWCNKLWNAIRFAIDKLGDDYVPPSIIDPSSLPFVCQWILSYQLCDVYIEAIKPYFNGKDPKFLSERKLAKDTLWICLDNELRLLHPFMPFVTEELWQRLPCGVDNKQKESIMINDYPSEVEKRKEKVEYEMDLVESAVKSLRSLAQERRERPSEKLNGAHIKEADVEEIKMFITRCDLSDIASSGFHFTWSNNNIMHENRIWCKLDRGMENSKWFNQYPDSSALFLPPGISDHCPAVVSWGYRHRRRPSFRYCNF
ncbi:unnamed protein product [Rhodiola kirilowii]